MAWEWVKRGRGEQWNEGNDSFLEPKKESKKAACDVKVNWIKIERDHWPHAGQGKFCVTGSAQAPSVPLNISPLVWLCQPWHPAALSAAPQMKVECGNRAQ